MKQSSALLISPSRSARIAACEVYAVHSFAPVALTSRRMSLRLKIRRAAWWHGVTEAAVSDALLNISTVATAAALGGAQ